MNQLGGSSIEIIKDWMLSRKANFWQLFYSRQTSAPKNNYGRACHLSNALPGANYPFEQQRVGVAVDRLQKSLEICCPKALAIVKKYVKDRHTRP
jgi:hypothetical protein